MILEYFQVSFVDCFYLKKKSQNALGLKDILQTLVEIDLIF